MSTERKDSSPANPGAAFDRLLEKLLEVNRQDIQDGDFPVAAGPCPRPKSRITKAETGTAGRVRTARIETVVFHLPSVPRILCGEASTRLTSA